MTYLAVKLAAGERWTYEPPLGHTVAWLAVHTGSLSVPSTVGHGELVVFGEGERRKMKGETGAKPGPAHDPHPSAARASAADRTP